MPDNDSSPAVPDVQEGFDAASHRPIETDGRGNLLYKIYGQDGAFVDMKCEDTPSNRQFVMWLRQHDRYTPRTTSHV